MLLIICKKTVLAKGGNDKLVSLLEAKTHCLGQQRIEGGEISS